VAANPSRRPDSLGGRAWLSLGVLAGSVLAGTLYVLAWRRLLLIFLGPVDVGTVLVSSSALMGVGLGAAAAWRILWRGAVFVPTRRGRPRRARASDGAHRPPLLSFGLVNLAAALLMLGLLLARLPLTRAFAAWPTGYLWPPVLEMPYRFLLVLIVVWPPMMLMGFGVGLMMYGWGRPRFRRLVVIGRLGQDETDWAHGLEVPVALMAGVALGLAAGAVLDAGRSPYTDWVLLAALGALIVAAVSVAVSQRLSLAEAPVSERKGPAQPARRDRRASRHRWRRFRTLALMMGFLLGMYAISAEVVRRRGAAAVAAEGVAAVLLTSLAAMLVGMIGRPLIRGEAAPEWPEVGYAALATGCVGLMGLAWLGWLGRRVAAGAEPFAGAAAVSSVVAAAPVIGLGWVNAFGLGAARRVADHHARAAAGLGAATVGAGLGALVGAVLIVPFLGPGSGAIAVMLAAVLSGVVVLSISPVQAATLRVIGIGAGLLISSTLLAAIRASGIYDRRSARPMWRQSAVSLRGEVTVHAERSPRLNGRPLAGTREPAALAALRGQVPVRTCPRLEKVLVHVGGDPRLLAAMAADDGRLPRLVVCGEQVSGVCRFADAAGKMRGFKGSVRSLFPLHSTRIRTAAPAFPEHLVSTRVLYDLIVVDLRAARAAELQRLACRETVARLGERLTVSGQAWYWLPLSRLTRDGLCAMLTTWLDGGAYTGVWLWEEPGSGAVLCAMVTCREPFGTLRPPTRTPPLSPDNPLNVGKRLLLVGAARLAQASGARPLTLTRPGPRLLRPVANERDRAAALSENLDLLQAVGRPLAEVWAR